MGIGIHYFKDKKDKITADFSHAALSLQNLNYPVYDYDMDKMVIYMRTDATGSSIVKNRAMFKMMPDQWKSAMCIDDVHPNSEMIYLVYGEMAANLDDSINDETAYEYMQKAVNELLDFINTYLIAYK